MTMCVKIAHQSNDDVAQSKCGKKNKKQTKIRAAIANLLVSDGVLEFGPASIGME